MAVDSHYVVGVQLAQLVEPGARVEFQEGQPVLIRLLAMGRSICRPVKQQFEVFRTESATLLAHLTPLAHAQTIERITTAIALPDRIRKEGRQVLHLVVKGRDADGTGRLSDGLLQWLVRQLMQARGKLQRRLSE